MYMLDRDGQMLGFLEAADPVVRGKWHTVSMPNEVPSKHGTPGTWDARELEGLYWLKLVIGDTAYKWLH